jgi:dihydroxyacid dehydratase/phosphogluconate dehydratase
MRIEKKMAPGRTINVLIRITPEMQAQLQKIAGKAGGGVATVMRQIVQNALDEGVKVVQGKARNGSSAEA